MSFSSDLRERSRPVLPLAAMVDVLFLLLIFFMTASVFRESEAQMDINIPQAATPEPGTRGADSVIVNISSDNRVYIGEREIAMDQLPGEFARLAVEAGVKTIIVRGDQGCDWGVGIRVVDIAYEAGIEEVSASTVRPAEELE